jgi:hypothetical protein
MSRRFSRPVTRYRPGGDGETPNPPPPCTVTFGGSWGARGGAPC